MSRPLPVVLALVLAMPGWTAAQDRVRLEVGVNQARQPVVRTPGILRDNRWLEALRNSFPLRMRFRVEIWRVRTDWFDAHERAFEWETVVQYQPLVDEYSRTGLWGGSVRQVERFGTLAELERRMEQDNVVAITPAGPGEYYFIASLEIRTLTDQEMEDLERFLRGVADPIGPQEDPGSPVSRTTRRILLRFGGLPYQELEAKSSRFQVNRED
jgi:hypothetical protein